MKFLLYVKYRSIQWILSSCFKSYNYAWQKLWVASLQPNSFPKHKLSCSYCNTLIITHSNYHGIVHLIMNIIYFRHLPISICHNGGWWNGEKNSLKGRPMLNTSEPKTAPKLFLKWAYFKVVLNSTWGLPLNLNINAIYFGNEDSIVIGIGERLAYTVWFFGNKDALLVCWVLGGLRCFGWNGLKKHL